MNKPKRYRFSLTLLLVVTLTLTGCWNRREIDQLNFVIIAGIDVHPQGFLLTAQVANPESMSKKGTSKAPSFFTYTSTGQTMFDALRKATHAAQFRLFWSHNKVVVISEEMARDGISPILEYFSRDAETRRNFLIAITPRKAREILALKVQTENVPGIALTELLQLYRATSTSPTINLNDFLRLSHTTQCPITPVVKIVKDQGGKENYYVQGAAVFVKDRLATFLEPIETRGVLWVLGEVKSGIIVTKCPNDKATSLRNKISFEIFKSSVDVKPIMQKGKLSIQVKIKESGNLAESHCTKDEVSPQALTELKQLKNDKIKAEVEAALKKARQTKCDVFGFGEAIHRTYPQEWRKLKQNWPTHFATLPVSIQVKSEITSSALIQREK